MGAGENKSMQRYTAGGVRLTADPEVRYTTGANAMAVARFRIAVNRRGKKVEGQQEADFIPCVAFGKVAEFCEKYLRKGSKVNLEGRITSGSYTNKEGAKVYTLEVAVDDIEFDEPKNQGGKSYDGNVSTAPVAGNGFMNIPEGIDEEMPFMN